MIACESVDSAVLNRVLSFSNNQDMSVGPTSAVQTTVQSAKQPHPMVKIASNEGDPLCGNNCTVDVNVFAAASPFVAGGPGVCDQSPVGIAKSSESVADAPSTSEHSAAGEVPSGERISDGYSEVDATIDTEVVYVKENVWVWPTQNARIMGRLTLTCQHKVLFLSWLPYASGVVNQDGTFHTDVSPEKSPRDKDQYPNRTRYAIRPTAITDIEAVTRHTPTLGCHYMVLVLRSGVALAPLYFQNGGIKTLLNVLKAHVYLSRALSDPNTYIVTDGGGPVRAQLSVDLSDVLMGAPPRDADATVCPRSWPPSAPAGQGWQADESEGPWLGRSLLAMQLEQFADRSVKRLQRLFFPDADLDEVQHEMSLNTAMSELLTNGPLNRARQQLCQTKLGQVASAQIVQEEETRAEQLSSAADLRQATTTVGVFEIIEQAAVSTSGRSQGRTAPPLEADEWASFMDDEGRITDPTGLKARVYESGVCPELRKEVWKFLLGLFPIDSSARQRAVTLRRLCDEYEALKQQWVSISPTQAAHWSKWRERRTQVEKDVLRTDRDVPDFSCSDSSLLVMMQNVLLTYVMYNQDLGYSQGMSDLLAPILYVTRHEAEAFWCFVKLMERVGGNFDTDQRCVQLQLGAVRQLVQLLDPPMHEAIKRAGCLDYFCCFRWIMVVLKREFVFEDVQRLWEVLWTNPFTPHFHLYVSVVMLEYRRAHILEEGLDYASMHQLCNQLRGKLDLKSVLADAEALCKYAGEAGLALFADVPTLTDVQCAAITS